jgi:predicted nucleic acid-binding Zn ribbon protein
MGQYSLGDAIQEFMKGSRLKGELQALQVGDVWAELMGKTIAKYTERIALVGGTLFITTHVAPLKQELSYQKEKIKLRVTEALGEPVVKEVVIQ